MDPFAQVNDSLRGRYELEREIGQGGMATVFLARDLRHERHVALKALSPELGAVLGAERFLAEIRGEVCTWRTGLQSRWRCRPGGA